MLSALPRLDLSDLKAHLARKLIIKIAVTVPWFVPVSIVQKYMEYQTPHQVIEAGEAHQFKPAKHLSSFFFFK